MVKLKSESLKNKILVTSYKNPDLDGTACIIAYSELLKRKGIDTNLGIIGKPHREVKFLFDNFNVECPDFNRELIEEFDKFILVDASERTGLPEKIDINEVIEVIDHRKSNEVQVFKNAKIQIELVGAAATLITEKFMKSGIRPGRSSSILLYGAIVSNTLNFKSNTTTERDKKAAKWLKERIKLPKDFVKNMFLAKSSFEGKDLREILIQDYKTVDKDVKSRFGIFQLEVVDLAKIITGRKQEIIEVLEEFKERQRLNYVFLTGIDLEKGFNMFVVVDDKTKNLLVRSLKVNFIGNIGKREGLLMRKEIIPIIEKHM